MATVPMPMTDQDMPCAVAYENGSPQEEPQETTAQEMYHDLPDASLHDCRVEMVPLKDIYIERAPQDKDLVARLAAIHSSRRGSMQLSPPYGAPVPCGMAGGRADSDCASHRHNGQSQGTD